METRAQQIYAKADRNISIDIIPGHFATNHSHVNYYVDMTSLKTRHKMARSAAELLASKFSASTPIDTIISLEGTQVIGAFLAQALSADSARGMNSGSDIAVITPEVDVNNQMIFRDNTQNMVWGKNILLLISSASTGKTINRSINCLEYYNGRLVGVGALFSAAGHVHEGIQVQTIFTEDDIPSYKSSEPAQCEMCGKKQKIDAIVNSFGYSKI